MKEIKALVKDKALLFYHIEWILMHPRFGFLMLALVALSFTHVPWLAAILFLIFSVEIIARVAIIMYKTRINPYRTSLNRKIDGMFLVLDIIGIASLLITIFDMPIQAEDAALVRLFRAMYLLRTLRIFRYFDLQSAMYSPTYGMFTSLTIMVSFFATDTLLWVILIFFSVELILRYILMQNMNFKTAGEKNLEWVFWWLDVAATIVMVPAFAIIPYGGALRMMRLIRLLRPWMVIIRNLRDVMREGQFMQEINLIVLVLAVISIAGGIFGKFTMPNFDFTRDGIVNELDDSMISRIWFSFRLFTDPGNAVSSPDSTALTLYSIVAVIVGVFIFAFFIGIGANIVSDLMTKLRNERLSITRHMVMFGWNPVAPYIINYLRLVSERSFSRIKLVLLHHDENLPPALLEEKWVTFRHGDAKQALDLKRVNLSAARQALVLFPENMSDAESLSETFFSLLSIRNIHPDIYLSIAVPSVNHARIPEHQHMLQVGWDSTGEYNKPTVILSESDFRANTLKNIIQYGDFDQVISRLMVPERAEESSIQVIEWSSVLEKKDGIHTLQTFDKKFSADIQAAAQSLLMRGVTLLALIDEQFAVHPIYCLDGIEHLKICGIAGIALNENTLHGELYYVLRNPVTTTLATTSSHDHPGFAITRHQLPATLRLLITGWVGSLPLLLKRLIADYQNIEVVLLNNLSETKLANEKKYIEQGLVEHASHQNITVAVKFWDFSDMEALRPYVKSCTHILLSNALDFSQKPYTIISTMLSHIISMINSEDTSPQIFPVLSDRLQARLLQEELERFTLPTQVHVIVPDELYGAYVAHTNFHMYTSENDNVYAIKRVLRHIIHNLMSEDGTNDSMGLYTIDVHEVLPNEPEALYALLLKQGYVWIGYHLKNAFVWNDPLQNIIRRAFPRESDFHCMKQHEIIINAFGNPISRRSWENHRQDIVELIVIGENLTSPMEDIADTKADNIT